MNITALIALKLVPEHLKSQPVFLCIDDTMVAKFGKKFGDVSKLFDHAAHNGSNYLNGHCFVSLMFCVPVWRKQRIVCLAVPLGYRMWKKETSRLELAANMVRQIMPDLSSQKNVILLCDSWYAKEDLACVVDEYANLDMICNARHDSVLYDLAPQPTGKKAGLPNMEDAFPRKRISLFLMKRLGIIILACAGSSPVSSDSGKCLPV